MKNFFLVLAAVVFIGIAAPARADDATPSPDFAAKLLSAKKGDAKAQVSLGLMYASGEGVSQDYPEAMKWYRLAAQQGNDKAQFLLAQLYFYGAQGVDKNYAEASKWYGLSAKQGNAMAQSTLGVMYSKGLGVTRDYQEAYFWFLLSSSAGWDAAVTGRDMTEKRLSPDQIIAVKKRAKEWKAATAPQ